jgi:hypothetical protein
MRIIKGGLIVNQLDKNNYIVKDAGIGIKVNELPVKITKKSIMIMLSAYNIPFDKKESKSNLESKLKMLYKQNFPVNITPIKPIEPKPVAPMGTAIPSYTPPPIIPPIIPADVPEPRKRVMPRPKVRNPDISL